MGMAGYTKLFNSILASTIWRAPNTTRIVWITMLAMADKDGVVEGSVPGLADFARVSVDDARTALETLLAPDPDSRTEDYDGRRIEVLPGTGWRLLNHAKYRAKMNDDERRAYNRKKQAEWREKVALKAAPGGVKKCQTMSMTVNDKCEMSAMSAQAAAEAAANAGSKSTSPSAPVAAKASTPPEARTVLDHLNLKADRQFRPTPANLKLIAARLWDVGGDLEGVLATVDRKVAQWKGDPKMDEYLRPETLFGKQKFGGYYDTRTVPVHPNGATPTPTSQPIAETPEQRDRRILREAQR